MADQYPNESSSTGNVSGKSSDAIVEINVKTLESQVYSFQVDKNIPVTLFKEKIANDIGVPVGQQRLIFRGKVLKDEHLLSEYHVENGHTLHLVIRQPAQSQPSSDASSGETNRNNVTGGSEANANAPRGRMGQVSHSVLLGTFNVGDQGEGIAPDLTRVIGALINSLGIGGQTPATGSNSGIQFSTLSNIHAQPQQGNETAGSGGHVGNQSQVGNQAQSGQPYPGQLSSPPVVQIPQTAGAVPFPSLNVPIPDSLNTISEFMNHMEQTLSQNGYQPNTSSTSNEEVPRPELPSNERGLPTPEALNIVLQRAQRLLSGHTVAALSHIAGRLEQEGASSDPNIRGQIQAESVQIGFAMQHLGSLLLELGRVILTLRMGQSPVEFSVNAGPAVYISPSGPNPIMVQPFPIQTSSLFGGSVPSSNPMNIGPVGVGHAPRNINIHIHAGTALAPVLSTIGTRASNGDGVQGERRNATGSTELAGSGSVRVLPVRNIIAAAVPSRPTAAAISTVAQPGPGLSVPQLSANSAEVMSAGQNLSDGSMVGSYAGNEQPSSTPVNRVGELRVSLSGNTPESESQKQALPEGDHVRTNEGMGSVLSSKDAPSSSSGGAQSSSSGESEDNSGNALGSIEKQDLQEGSKAAPLGLGLGGLERKRRPRQPKTPVKSSDGGMSNAPLDQNLNSTSVGQHLLQTLASSSSVRNGIDANELSFGQLPVVERVTESKQSGGQDIDSQVDTASAISEVLRSTELNGLLSGFSQQTGIGSPDVLRNMLQQLTQSPQVLNTVNQIAQQIDTQDVGNMFSGLGGGWAGGIDLSRMVQQMMPVVSQALGRGSTPQPLSGTPQCSERRSSGVDNPDDPIQIGIQQVVQRIEHLDPPGEVFRAVVQNAGQLHCNGSGREDLVSELCSDEDLAEEYAEILRSDIYQRLKGDSGRDC
ncbi:ubiquitin-like domain-containing protein CIP73 isoform X3 [Citrus sinensis]|uniref:ubiquitin-like domain-containing protein CIP73 isoform X3 n=1 Tax=Citrus sinensis TaxID=2711 RepID=UPI00227982BD|nr:ubiquitin-like domain-containing protein CIP73 isoform X3 [Citrus sinensis]